jgi:benzodiazapine receptor
MDWILARGPAWLTLFGFFAAAFGAGATGALFKPGAWYRLLSKPAWTPPDWLFPVAWTILYVAMSIAVWWVSLSFSPWALAAVALWCWQIVMNALWSPVFFGLRRLDSAFAVIVALWIAVASTTAMFFVVSPFSGWLMVPYLVWVSYAGALNLSLWRRNGGAPDLGAVPA